MLIDGERAQGERSRYLFVAHAIRHELEDIALSVRYPEVSQRTSAESAVSLSLTSLLDVTLTVAAVIIAPPCRRGRA